MVLCCLLSKKLRYSSSRIRSLVKLSSKASFSTSNPHAAQFLDVCSYAEFVKVSRDLTLRTRIILSHKRTSSHFYK
ncbi:hypothetical protein TNCV_3034121 [Trichonephila clavipes]|nr:hypothetical protein TNCV_3034121 [Trichonephila clavipes]